MTKSINASLLVHDQDVYFDIPLFDRLVEQLPEPWRFKQLIADGENIDILIENKSNGRLNRYRLDPVFECFKPIATIYEGTSR